VPTCLLFAFGFIIQGDCTLQAKRLILRSLPLTLIGLTCQSVRYRSLWHWIFGPSPTKLQLGKPTSNIWFSFSNKKYLLKSSLQQDFKLKERRDAVVTPRNGISIRLVENKCHKKSQRPNTEMFYFKNREKDRRRFSRAGNSIARAKRRA